MHSADAGAPDLIVGDWGTSQLRLYLCAGDQVVDRLRAGGLTRMLDQHERPDVMFADQTAEWMVQHGPLPALLCGMVGSNLGWVDAGYAPCPADAALLASRLASAPAAAAPVAIVPGVAGQSLLDAPDVMRGEETQVVGALALHPGLASGRHWLCLPGTHSKWVRLDDGAIAAFQTCLTGELFALLRDHSILLRGAGDLETSTDAFLAGVRRIEAVGGGALPGLLFETRSRQLRAGLSLADAQAFLSGLIIGAELSWIAGLMKGVNMITMIGEPALAGLYAEAARHFGLTAALVDGEAAVIAGLLQLARPR